MDCSAIASAKCNWMERALLKLVLIWSHEKQIMESGLSMPHTYNLYCMERSGPTL